MTADPTLTARLSMYDWPQTRAANDELWARWRTGLRAKGVDTPDSLDRETQDERSLDGLLVGQVCGVTYAKFLSSKARLVATPCYGAAGCIGPNYCSMVVVRNDDSAHTMTDLAGRSAAVNSKTSFSGWFALHAASGHGEAFFGDYTLTGSHLASAQAVVQGRADCAALDAVCWAMIGRYLPDLHDQLRVLAQSPSLPGLPLIAGPACDDRTVEILRETLVETLADPAMDTVKESLLVTGAEILGDADYRKLLAYV